MAGTIIPSDDEVEVEEYTREANDEYMERQRKKKRKTRESEKNYVFGDDDYELLQDDVGFQRRKADDRIREIDISERMQISEESTGPPPTDEKSIDDESKWILNQLVTGMVPLFSKERHELALDKGDIVRFLELTHVQKLDVPFIAMYRKEECRSLFNDPELQDNNPEGKPMLRWHKVLWAILELDRKWLLLQKRKRALQSYYNTRFEQERNIYDETRLHLNKKLFDSITKSLKGAESEQEVDDVDSKFNLHFPSADVAVGLKKNSQYSICSKSGLWEVATKFGCSSEKFGLLISSREEMRTVELEHVKRTPEEVASKFTCAMFKNPQAVLRGARHMVAVEISCEPCVRRHVRGVFMDNAVVSTNPTADGKMSIDSRHQFAGIKWLKNKPLTKFEDAQWLLIQKAEEEKLIQVSLKLPESIRGQLINDAHNYYLRDGVGKSVKSWNEQRKQIISDAYDGLLLPSMAKEAQALLTSRAKKWLLMEYGGCLWDKVSVAPYQRKDHDVNSLIDYDVARRVMVCCWGPGKPTTTFVMLDSYGEVLDVLYAGSISLRGQNANDQQRKNDQQRVSKFLTDHQPHVVVIGAVNLSCIWLRDCIFEIIFKMIEDDPRDVGHEMDDINVVYGDETLPHLYENSRISSEQLQPQTGIVKRAVALGRYLQNPLAMTATLCGPTKEILSWKLIPLENFLTPDEKYSMVEQNMVDATNQVGLDINLAICHEWLFAPLQFISGIGPRKAASLQRSLVRAGSIYTRKDLLDHGLGRKVFVNAVGFLRVRRSGNAASSSQFIDLLDDTRIHPESYSLAEKLAEDIFTAAVGQNDVNDEDALEMVIEHVRENPYLLKCLIVDKYAKDRNFENKKETLNHTRLELIQGFQDWRKPYREPNSDEELYMMTGETEETFSVGKIVQVTVRRVQPQRAVCVLDSGLTGILSKDDYSDDSRYCDLTKKLVEGDIFSCQIKSIRKRHGDRPQVFLSCKESDLRSGRSQNSKALDPYYHEDRDNLAMGPPVVDPVQRYTSDDRLASLELEVQRQGEELREATRMLRAMRDHHGIRAAPDLRAMRDHHGIRAGPRSGRF